MFTKKDIASTFVTRPLLWAEFAHNSVGNGATYTSLLVDRRDAFSGSLLISGKVNLRHHSEFTVTIAREQSGDGETWGGLVEIAADVVLITGGSGGDIDEPFIYRLNENYAPLQNYIRYQITQNLTTVSGSGLANSATWHAIAIVGGQLEVPV